MKNKFLTIMAVTALFVMLAAGSTYAQSDVIKVSVPFDFDISGKTFPAGGYFVRRSIEGPNIVLMIFSEVKNEAVYLTTHPVKARDFQQESRLVFNKYGDQYFLSQVWTSGRNDGEELARTRRERLLQREMAKRTTQPEAIAILSKSK